MTKNKKGYLSPLACWDIYSEYYHRYQQKAKVDFDLKQLGVILKTTPELGVIDKINEEAYDALVVTDISQKIIWVSRGFREMTGYSKSYAIGKSPRFLQGPQTSNLTKRNIRERLALKDSFTESILNYRKNGEEYLCQIKIIPLFDPEKNLTHYLAVERELRAS